MPKKSVKPKWRTIRCVVEYRTPDPNFSERDLCGRVQGALDHYLQMPDSKPWAKQFTSMIARMEAVRPKRMQAALRALDAAVARLRKL